MRTPEDARRDPRPGDVLRIYGNRKHPLECTVTFARKAIRFTVPTRKGPLPCECSWEEWRNWAATAEVLKVAQPDA